MKKEDLFEAIGGADEKYLAESEKKRTRVRVLPIAVSAAACLLIAIGVAAAFITPSFWRGSEFKDEADYAVASESSGSKNADSVSDDTNCSLVVPNGGYEYYHKPTDDGSSVLEEKNYSGPLMPLICPPAYHHTFELSYDQATFDRDVVADLSDDGITSVTEKYTVLDGNPSNLKYVFASSFNDLLSSDYGVTLNGKALSPELSACEKLESKLEYDLPKNALKLDGMVTWEDYRSLCYEDKNYPGYTAGFGWNPATDQREYDKDYREHYVVYTFDYTVETGADISAVNFVFEYKHPVYGGAEVFSWGEGVESCENGYGQQKIIPGVDYRTLERDEEGNLDAESHFSVYPSENSGTVRFVVRNKDVDRVTVTVIDNTAEAEVPLSESGPVNGSMTREEMDEYELYGLIAQQLGVDEKYLEVFILAAHDFLPISYFNTNTYRIEEAIDRFMNEKRLFVIDFDEDLYLKKGDVLTISRTRPAGGGNVRSFDLVMSMNSNEIFEKTTLTLNGVSGKRILAQNIADALEDGATYVLDKSKEHYFIELMQG